MSTTPTPIATPIRQPRGPGSSSGAFGTTPPPPTSGPPIADLDSLRRSNTVSTPRHQVSASISSSAAGSSAFHGGMRFKGANGGGGSNSRLRSGSLSSSGGSGDTLVRRGSGRAVQKQEPVIESGEEGATHNVGSAWGKGLARQSSLPSRKMINPVASADGSQPPPRPPRRMINTSVSSMNPPAIGSTSAHAASHSLSSLTMLQPRKGPITPDSTTNEVPQTLGAGVSRTQSLRDQARHHDVSSLARSASMRTATEHGRPPHPMEHIVSPTTQPSTPRNPFTPPTPPPVSSTAALPPFPLPDDSAQTGAEVRRHQSFTHGYANGRRERSSGALLSIDQRQDNDQTPRLGQDRIEPPTSPIGRSVWSPSHGGDDGWNRSLTDSFEAMQLGKRMMDPPGTGAGPQNGSEQNVQHHPQEEPAWVTNLVGHQERRSPGPRRSPHRQQQPGQPDWSQPQPLHFSVGYPGQPSLKPQYQPYMTYMTPPPAAQMYPSPPGSANQLADVMELARSKGLNPSTFDCRPPQARFFVIKSYTEDDVQKSLKHGIWSSTVLGNKRLDGAFRESADKMPIYLFFSVNGSRHFCGVAQMLTPVDESQSSTVWAQDKWKGIFKVKWIFVRDVPTSALRHIRLLNTPEQKPITNSRDTQELHYEAGCEVLDIFLDYQTKSKTSLLQDFAYYEQLAQSRNGRPMMPPPQQQGMQQQGMQQPGMPQQQPQMAMQMPPPLQMGGVPPVPPIPSRYR